MNARVVAVSAQNERVTGVRLADGTDVTADNVVVAAGPWSSALDGIPAGASIPVHPIKGQILRLHDPAGPGLLTRVLRMTGGYLVPRGDGRYVLGATMEERGFDTTVTAGGAFELLRNAFELLPSVTELVIDELSAGLRPATPDNAPAIGPGSIAGPALGHRALPPRHPARAGNGARSWPQASPGMTRVSSRRSSRRRALRRWRYDRFGDGQRRRRELPDGATVASVVASLPNAPEGRGVAVAVEGEVVPRAQWRDTELREGDNVEIVVAVQGG